MTSKLAFHVRCISLVLCLCCFDSLSLGAAKPSPNTPTSSAPTALNDARLERKVDIWADTGIRVRDVLKELSRQSQVSLECEFSLADTKVYCEAQARSLRSLMMAVPRGLAPEGRGLRWARSVSGYRLDLDPDSMKSVIRDEENAGRRRVETLRSAVYFTQMTPAEKAAALAKSPEIEYLFEPWEGGKSYRQPSPYFFSALQCFSRERVRSLLEEGEELSIAFSQLPESVKQFMQDGSHRLGKTAVITKAGKLESDLEHSIFTFYMQGDEPEKEVWVHVKDTRHPGLSGSIGIGSLTFGLPERTISQIQSARARDKAQRDSYDRIGSLTVRAQSSDRDIPRQMPGALFWALDRIHERMDYLVAEPGASSASVASRGVFSAVEALRRAQTSEGASLEYVLDRIAVATGNTWSLIDGKLVVFSPIGFKAYKRIAPPSPASKKGTPAKQGAPSKAIPTKDSQKKS